MPWVVKVCGRRGATGAAGEGVLAKGSVTQSSWGTGARPYIRSLSCHCERSEAIHLARQAERMDCFVAFAPLRKRSAFAAGNDGGEFPANYSVASPRRRLRTPVSGSPRAPRQT